MKEIERERRNWIVISLFLKIKKKIEAKKLKKRVCIKDRHRELKDGVLHKGSVGFSILAAALLPSSQLFFHLIKHHSFK